MIDILYHVDQYQPIGGKKHYEIIMKSNKPIEACIVNVRRQKVILDADLAQLYEVPTKVFNQALKRHANRFPGDFLFELTLKEWSNLRSQFVTSSSNATQNIVDETNAKCMVGGSHGGRRTLPHALTEHGVIMAVTIYSHISINMLTALPPPRHNE